MIKVRRMCESDPAYFAAEEVLQGWVDAVPAKLERRLQDERDGLCITYVAEVDGVAAGYVSLYLRPTTGAFANQGIPEIVDFNVLEKFRRQGIGSALMDAAEADAAKRCDRVYLGVGLHSGYGSAQRLYVKRGYVPDGSGVWYNDRVCDQNVPCANDDDLVLYLSKPLRRVAAVSYLEVTSSSLDEIKALYMQHGWQSYLQDDEKLIRAFDHSLYVMGAYDGGELVGFIRCVGDGEHIVMVQDLIVAKTHQRQGIGGRLMQFAGERFADVRMFTLMTDALDEADNAFYQAMGMRKIEQNGCVSYMR